MDNPTPDLPMWRVRALWQQWDHTNSQAPRLVDIVRQETCFDPVAAHAAARRYAEQIHETQHLNAEVWIEEIQPKRKPRLEQWDIARRRPQPAAQPVARPH